MTGTHDTHAAAAADPAAPDAAQEAASEFPATLPLPDDLEPGVWAESADGRCSEHAALFAVSQPAPLSIV